MPGEVASSRPDTLSLGRGQRVPYPTPTSEAASTVGKANRRRDTTVEIETRRVLHRLGLRFRKDMLIRVGSIRTHPDVVFTAARVVVFLDGCFWHCCPEHFNPPKSNFAYWGPKLARNVERDRIVTATLTEHGWEVVRAWEHEHPDLIVARVVERLAAQQHAGGVRALASLRSMRLSDPET